MLGLGLRLVHVLGLRLVHVLGLRLVMYCTGMYCTGMYGHVLYGHGHAGGPGTYTAGPPHCYTPHAAYMH